MGLSKEQAIKWSISELRRIKDEAHFSGHSLGDIGFMQFFTDKPPVGKEDRDVLEAIYEACEYFEKATASIDKAISILRLME